MIHNFATGSRTPFGPSSQHAAEFAAFKDVPEAVLLFLRGYPSPQWLRVIGNKHGVNPDLYQRHFQYKTFTAGGRDLCSSPSLPSSSSRIIQLTISTICAESSGRLSYEPEDLEDARHQESDAIGKKVFPTAAQESQRGGLCGTQFSAAKQTRACPRKNYLD